ncbi:hypothetical protein, variant 3 [Phialophora macrospora]|nr:hypothetical protein, variant 1 [Phialophora macrospora]KIW73448.1 hypothetical protein, variant 2 [Phialophora macrospora]KIW73449.1 hypothetical protein, variant 3 [Phialophora macrospora]
MTRRTFQPPSGPLKIEPPSPERLHTGSSLENFDSMSAQSGDSAYAAHRHHRQNSSWTSASHYTELVSPYSGHQRAPCTVQTQFAQPKPEPSLPSIHDLTYNQPFPTASPYPYGASAGAYTDHRGYSIKTESPYTIKTETPSYYESPHRYGQSYPQMNRPQSSNLDYQRYPSAMFDYPKGLAYTSPYGVDYIPSPTGSHHPVSPTVSNGEGCGPGSRRRRGNLPKHITDYLKNWFLAHLDHPYPTEDEKQQFVHDTQLSLAQISNWFINARRRHLPTWRHQAQENSRRAAQASAVDYDSEQGRRSHKSFD